MPQITLDARAYQTAERLMGHNRGTLVRSARIKPMWIEDGARFWYTLDTAEGRRFMLADPRAGMVAPAFDHDRLATALAAASGQEVSADAPPLMIIGLTTEAVEFFAFGAPWRCSLTDYSCSRVEGTPPGGNPLEIPSPDGKLVVYRAGHDLWVRSLADGRERALTTDGTEDLDYGANPDYLMRSTLLAKVGLPHLPPAVAWSPDSTRLLTHRTDQRGVRHTHLVNVAPADGGEPRLLTHRYPFPGDEHVPRAEYVVIDVESGTVVPARAEPVAMSMMSPIFQKWAWWAEDGSAVYYLSWTRQGRTLGLHRLDPATGEVRTVLSESGETRVEPAQQQTQEPNVRVLSGGTEVLWYSQRDGWGHLYLYDARTGELKNRVTSGAWGVQQILHIDERRRVVRFVASGLVAEDPYRRSVCAADLDGAGVTRLTDDDLDHVAVVAANGAYFIDSASTNTTAPVITARDWNGRVLVELAHADATALTETGWTAPERFTATAADGRTEIYGLLYRPHGFDPAKRYPVIDTPYGLSMGNRVSPAFDPGYYGYEAETLAALGFVVVAVDGRGSPGRDKAFHDATYARLHEDSGLADHVAALRELAATRPWMDLDRVGIVGMSAGGYAAVRGMLEFPEFFKVGIAQSGMHDFRCLDQGLVEAYVGPGDDATYTAAGNVAGADRLRGRLLLIHGGLDDRVSPHLTLRLAERLIAADKDFELLIVPGADHIYLGYEHYINRRKWDFLVRHLLGAEPPAGYRITPVPLDMETIGALFG